MIVIKQSRCNANTSLVHGGLVTVSHDGAKSRDYDVIATLEPSVFLLASRTPHHGWWLTGTMATVHGGYVWITAEAYDWDDQNRLLRVNPNQRFVPKDFDKPGLFPSYGDRLPPSAVHSAQPGTMPTASAVINTTTPPADDPFQDVPLRSQLSDAESDVDFRKQHDDRDYGKRVLDAIAWRKAAGRPT